MNTETFIQAVCKILSAAISGLIRNIQDPPGRNPSTVLLRISKFYKNLNEEDKQVFQDALELSAKQSVNNFLLVLDGSLAIESDSQKGQLELFYNDNIQRTRLNDPEEYSLSDIFKGYRGTP